MLVLAILKINRDLPIYNYYLDLADYLINEVYLQVKRKENLWSLDTKIKEISEAITTATSSYKEEQDPNKKTAIKRKGYIKKSNRIRIKFAELKTFLKKKGLLSVGMTHRMVFYHSFFILQKSRISLLNCSSSLVEKSLGNSSIRVI